MKKQLWIDTDFGGDVDDALALTAALRSEDISLVGVSTVYLRPDWRAQCAMELMQRIHADPVPVYVGCGCPIAGKWDEKNIPDTGIPPKKAFILPDMHAVDALLSALRQNPEMNLLAIGPLTNLGLALMKDASAFAHCHIYIMGGRITNAQPEWNILCDPEAACLVLEAGLDVALVPFDQTIQSKLTQADVDAYQGTPEREYLRKMMNTFSARFGFLPVMHDPMALAMLQKPDLFHFERHVIRVEKQGALTRGTLVDMGECLSGGVNVAVAVQLEGFFSWLHKLLME